MSSCIFQHGLHIPFAHAGCADSLAWTGSPSAESTQGSSAQGEFPPPGAALGACLCRAGNRGWTLFKFFHWLVLNFKFSACLARSAEEYCVDFCLHQAQAKQQHLSPAGNHLYNEAVDGSVSRPLPEYQCGNKRNESQSILVTANFYSGLALHCGISAKGPSYLNT